MVIISHTDIVQLLDVPNGYNGGFILVDEDEDPEKPVIC